MTKFFGLALTAIVLLGSVSASSARMAPRGSRCRILWAAGNSRLLYSAVEGGEWGYPDLYPFSLLTG